MSNLLPGTEVAARGLRWELVYTQNLGSQVLHRLRGIQGDYAGREIDLLSPFDEITPIARDLRPEKPAPLPNWLAYHQAFLLEQAFGMDALSAVQPGRLRIEPYQLVPVLRAVAAFDELQSIGLEAFTKKHNPYWDIPLNENLLQPVLDLPIPAAPPDAAPAKSHRELCDFQITPAPAGSGVLFTEQPVAKVKRGKRKG